MGTQTPLSHYHDGHPPGGGAPAARGLPCFCSRPHSCHFLGDLQDHPNSGPHPPSDKNNPSRLSVPRPPILGVVRQGQVAKPSCLSSCRDPQGMWGDSHSTASGAGPSTDPERPSPPGPGHSPLLTVRKSACCFDKLPSPLLIFCPILSTTPSWDLQAPWAHPKACLLPAAHQSPGGSPAPQPPFPGGKFLPSSLKQPWS